MSLNLKMNSGIIDEGVKVFSQCLKNLKSLQFVVLGLYGCLLTDEPLKDLGEALQSLSFLKSITLSLYAPMIDIKSFEEDLQRRLDSKPIIKISAE